MARNINKVLINMNAYKRRKTLRSGGGRYGQVDKKFFDEVEKNKIIDINMQRKSITSSRQQISRGVSNSRQRNCNNLVVKQT